MCVGKPGLLRYSTLGEGIGKSVYTTGFSHYFFLDIFETMDLVYLYAKEQCGITLNFMNEF